jgi:multidrug efflux pump subunit AcrA (membrane-fusion protein)
VLAPRSALRQENGTSYVWVVTSGKLRKQPVRTGSERGDRVVIADGLLGGEALVVGEAEGLAEGRRVEVAKQG